MDQNIKNKVGVLYIDADKCYFYEEGLSNKLQFSFPPDIVSNLEVLNKKKLVGFIQVFMKANGINPMSIIIILSRNDTFEEYFVGTLDKNQQNIQKFLELVPFEEVISKQFIFSDRIKVVAANKEFVDIVAKAFTDIMFDVKGVYPMALIQMLLPQLATNFDFHLILTKIAEFEKYNFFKIADAPVISTKVPPKRKTRLYALLSIFGVLLLILIIIIYMTFFTRKSPQNTLPVPNIILPTMSPVATSSATASSSATK